MKDNKNGLACDAAQELLIKKDFDALAEQEAFALAEHLQQCGSCVAFQTNLADINKFIRVSAAENLAPDPTIREQVRSKIKPPRQTIAGLSAIWRSVREVLNIKIPVYQAALGMAVVAAMLLALDKLNARGDGEIAKRAQMTQNEKQALAPPAVINHVAEIDSQKIGRTVADDSLLMKFMVTANGENI
jgi:hypothetical protein